jgi:hypothetical protein
MDTPRFMMLLGVASCTAITVGVIGGLIAAEASGLAVALTPAAMVDLGIIVGATVVLDTMVIQRLDVFA